ncbi:MAG: TetR family transcriptional regulator [Actinophytocola sp.]|nr:TetR family transcriptional regulator [Actinophytocola sp.]
MSTETVPRWRRLEPDERREQILACAIRLFGERPYAAVSTTDVAREAGVARGLINHYFDSKRGLYLEVVQRMVTVPKAGRAKVPTGPLRERVEFSVDWLLDAIGAHGKTWIAVLGTEGVGNDPEVERILAEADEQAAVNLLKTVGMYDAEPEGEQLRALVRAYGGMVKALGREWITHGNLTREQVQLVLTEQLITLLVDTFPRMQRQN